MAFLPSLFHSPIPHSWYLVSFLKLPVCDPLSWLYYRDMQVKTAEKAGELRRYNSISSPTPMKRARAMLLSSGDASPLLG